MRLNLSKEYLPWERERGRRENRVGQSALIVKNLSSIIKTDFAANAACHCPQ